MIELTKTRRLTIASVIFVLIILIGLITLRKPEYKYTISAQDMLSQVNDQENLIGFSDLNNPEIVLVDLRYTYDFNKGTIDNAINIPVSDILEKDVLKMMEGWQKESKLIVFFSNDIQSATAPWMLLRQMGFQNLKLLSGNYCQYNQLKADNALTQKAYLPEQPNLDYAQFIKDARGGEVGAPKSEPAAIIPIKRTKKSVTAGGC